MEQKRCISSLTLAELTAALKAMGQPGFRGNRREGSNPSFSALICNICCSNFF